MAIRGLCKEERSMLRNHALEVMYEYDLSYRQVARWLKKQYGYTITVSGAYYFINS